MIAWRRPVLAVAVAAVLALTSCGTERRLDAISVGVPALEQNALLYVAQDRGYFSRRGVAVTLKDFDAGPPAVAALMSGTVDVAETAEFPFVVSSMGGQRMRILAANDRFENDYLVARRARGISRVSDLNGKRIGVTMGAITEFYLSRFLTLHGIRRDSVTLVNVAARDFASSIEDNRVDAVVAWQPFVHRMVDRAPNLFHVWPVQSGQAVYGILVCEQDWLDSNHGAVSSFLEGLADAENLLGEHPAQAQGIVARRLGYSGTYLASVWPLHRFSITLDFSLVAAMEDEARWVADHHLASAGQDLDFGDLVYRDGLAGIRPEGVNLMP